MPIKSEIKNKDPFDVACVQARSLREKLKGVLAVRVHLLSHYHKPQRHLLRLTSAWPMKIHCRRHRWIVTIQPTMSPKSNPAPSRSPRPGQAAADAIAPSPLRTHQHAMSGVDERIRVD